MKRLSLILVLSLLFLQFRPAGEDPSEAVIKHNAALFEAILKSVNEHYVDSLDPSKLTRVAIDAMMHSLDPYSVYFDENETRDREKTWRGQLYAGIGAGVMPVDSSVVITEPYEGYGADLAGFRPGDVISAVDGRSVRGLAFEEVLRLLRGEPETPVQVTVDRPFSGKFTANITRKQIFTKSILFHTLTEDSLGYINVSQFLRGADTRFREIIQDLNRRGCKGYILDLRDNIGGLVQEAVNCLSCFLPEGTKVCSLKSKNAAANYDYITDQESVDIHAPVVILTNGVTVSSGEIFAGALQDLDRAVIIGQRTFGKGFVQGTRYPGFNTSIYLTAARYQTPSGRNIQELDYSSKYSEYKVKVLPDSLKKQYKTKNGRPVFSKGGIEPDIKTESNRKHELVNAILASGFLSDYATKYRNTTVLKTGNEFRLDELSGNYFLKSLMKEDVLKMFIISSEKQINELETKLKQDNIKNTSSVLSRLKAKIREEKSRIIQENKAEILSGLEKEIIRRYNNRSGVFKKSLTTDHEILLARELLKDLKKYEEILSRKQ